MKFLWRCAVLLLASAGAVVTVPDNAMCGGVRHVQANTTNENQRDGVRIRLNESCNDPLINNASLRKVISRLLSTNNISLVGESYAGNRYLHIPPGEMIKYELDVVEGWFHKISITALRLPRNTIAELRERVEAIFGKPRIGSDKKKSWFVDIGLFWDKSLESLEVSCYMTTFRDIDDNDDPFIGVTYSVSLWHDFRNEEYKHNLVNNPFETSQIIEWADFVDKRFVEYVPLRKATVGMLKAKQKRVKGRLSREIPEFCIPKYSITNFELATDGNRITKLAIVSNRIPMELLSEVKEAIDKVFAEYKISAETKLSNKVLASKHNNITVTVNYMVQSNRPTFGMSLIIERLPNDDEDENSVGTTPRLLTGNAKGNISNYKS